MMSGERTDPRGFIPPIDDEPTEPGKILPRVIVDGEVTDPSGFSLEQGKEEVDEVDFMRKTFKRSVQTAIDSSERLQSANEQQKNRLYKEAVQFYDHVMNVERSDEELIDVLTIQINTSGIPSAVKKNLLDLLRESHE